MLLRDDKKELLPNILVAPGGHKKFSEGIFECAKREIREETGIEICKIQLKAIGIGHSWASDIEYCNYILIADYQAGEVKQDGNNGKLIRMTEEEIKDHKNLFIEVKELLAYILESNNNIVSYIVEYNDINTNIPTTLIIEK